MTRWRLLRDLPWAGVGTESQESPVDGCVRFGASHTMYADFPLFIVERNRDWFEKIKPKKYWVIYIDAERGDSCVRSVEVRRDTGECCMRYPIFAPHIEEERQ